jgi:hypothetical protein
VDGQYLCIYAGAFFLFPLWPKEIRTQRSSRPSSTAHIRLGAWKGRAHRVQGALGTNRGAAEGDAEIHPLPLCAQNRRSTLYDTVDKILLEGIIGAAWLLPTTTHAYSMAQITNFSATADR